ncbi:MAG: class I SAM-dependent rRNA methyltransferase [bacterium]
MKIQVTEKGKRRVLNGHPWVFRSDLDGKPEMDAGVVSVHDSRGKFLSKALYSPRSQIALRCFTTRDETIDKEFWRKRLLAADSFRRSLSLPSDAYRVVFGESDGIPSFVLDRYGAAFSFQMLSAGLETQREILLALLQEEFQPELVVERNDVTVRKLEELPLCSQVIFGESSTRRTITEGSLQYEVDLLEGQKTGAFLDQRDNRLKAGELSRGKKKALDAFAYQGWFSCPMARGAEEVTALDQSGPACEQIKSNAALNGIQNLSVLEVNAFDYLKEVDQRKERFDLINLDPPAFVKTRSQLAQALKGYKEINLRALRLLDAGGLLITSSCSHHLSEAEFFEVIREAAHDARRTVQIIGIGHQAADHPVLMNFPESNYLKCFFLRVV